MTEIFTGVLCLVWAVLAGALGLSVLSAGLQFNRFWLGLYGGLLVVAAALLLWVAGILLL